MNSIWSISISTLCSTNSRPEVFEHVKQSEVAVTARKQVGAEPTLYLNVVSTSGLIKGPSRYGKLVILKVMHKKVRFGDAIIDATRSFASEGVRLGILGAK